MENELEIIEKYVIPNSYSKMEEIKKGEEIIQRVNKVGQYFFMKNGVRDYDSRKCISIYEKGSDICTVILNAIGPDIDMEDFFLEKIKKMKCRFLRFCGKQSYKDVTSEVNKIQSGSNTQVKPLTKQIIKQYSEKAISFYDKALEVLKDDELALFGKAISLRYLHRLDEADKIIDKLIKRKPTCKRYIGEKKNITKLKDGKHIKNVRFAGKTEKRTKNIKKDREYEKVLEKTREEKFQSDMNKAIALSLECSDPLLQKAIELSTQDSSLVKKKEKDSIVENPPKSIPTEVPIEKKTKKKIEVNKFIIYNPNLGKVFGNEDAEVEIDENFDEEEDDDID